MPIGLPTPYGGAGYNYGGGLLTPQGGGSFGGFSPLTQFGLGLLSQSGPSLTPQSPWSAIGKAGTYASEAYSQAQQAAMQNEYMRAKLAESNREAQQQQRMAAYFADHPELTADNPVLGALLQYGGPEAVKGVAATLSDPTLPLRREAAGLDVQNTQATLALNREKVATSIADNNLVWQNARAAEDAVEFLAKKPGGSALLSSDKVASAVRTGTSLAEAFGVDPGSVISLFPGLKDVNPKDIPQMLTAAETAIKARSTLASMLENGSNNAGVLGLQTFLTGQASGAGLDVQHEKFKQARQKAETIAKSGGADWSLPDPETYVWRGGQSVVPPRTVGVQNGQIVSQPPTVSSPAPVTTDLPPQPSGGGLIPPAAAAPAPAPTPRRTPTVSIDPQGRPVYARKADLERDIKNKAVGIGDTIIWNGQPFTLGPGQ